VARSLTISIRPSIRGRTREVHVSLGRLRADRGVLGRSSTRSTITVRSRPLGGPGQPGQPAGYRDETVSEDRSGGHWLLIAARSTCWSSTTSHRRTGWRRRWSATGPAWGCRDRARLTRSRRGLRTFPAISSVRFPHATRTPPAGRVLDVTKFLTTPREEKPSSVRPQTQPEALLQWFPQALLFGFWQSHLGRRSQARLGPGVDPRESPA